MRYISYEILGRGDIIVSNTVEVPNKKTHIFQFFASFAMVPRAQLIVHYMKDDEIVSDRLEINFGNELQNEVNHIQFDQRTITYIFGEIFCVQVTIELSAQKATPGQDIDIIVSSKPNSFIGLLGVDQSVLLLKKGNDLDKAEILDELDQYSRNYYPPSHWRGKRQFQYPYVDIWDNFNVSLFI